MAGSDFTRAVEFHQSWGQCTVVLLVLKLEGWGKRCALWFRVWRLGQLNWEASHSPVLQTDVLVPMETAGAALEGWPQGG